MRGLPPAGQSADPERRGGRAPACPRCGGLALTRLMSRFATVKAKTPVSSRSPIPPRLGDLDENDPASVARLMKKMGQEFGDDLGDDFESAVDEAMAESDGPGGEGDGAAGTPESADAAGASDSLSLVKIAIHDRLEAVGAPAWDALQAGSRLRSPFLTWTWQREWVRTFARGAPAGDPPGRPTATGQLVALLPLVETAPGSTDAHRRRRRLRLSRPDRPARPRGRGLDGAAGSPAPPSRSVWELHAVPEASPTVHGCRRRWPQPAGLDDRRARWRNDVPC